MVERTAPTKLTDASDAYWSGRLSEHLRWVLRDASYTQAASEALAEYDEWAAAQRSAVRYAPQSDGSQRAD